MIDSTTEAGSTQEGKLWVVACRRQALSEDFGTKVDLVGGRSIAIFSINGGYYATDDRCTHGDASLSEGLVEGGKVECPFHFGTFDIASGKALTFPCVTDLATYRVRLDGDEVWVEVPITTSATPPSAP